MVRKVFFFLAILISFGSGAVALANQEGPIMLRILGGLANVRQYTHFEERFWRETLPALSGGRIRAEIAPFDASGIRAHEMLSLMRVGVAPYGTALLAVSASEEPRFNAVDLPLVSPTMASQRTTVQVFRRELQRLLADEYDVHLLAVYTYPAQVIFCKEAFTSLSDLAGRRIRTSSVGQSEMIAALGGTPVVLPFNAIMNAVRGGSVDCAITGTYSGNTIGLHEVTSYISEIAITWGPSIFGVNRTAWNQLPTWAQDIIERGLAELEVDVWDAAEQETQDGIDCNTGQSSCIHGKPGKMTLVRSTPADENMRLQILSNTVLRGWVDRCGETCVQSWNETLAEHIGIRAKSP